MGRTLSALLKLQSVELQLVEVRNRLRVQSAAVASQQDRIERLRAEDETNHAELLTRQKDVASYELDLKTREEGVAKFRISLNTAKTNKEYAAILTQINTIKADNSKLEDQVLRLMQEVDQARSQAEETKKQIAEGEQNAGRPSEEACPGGRRRALPGAGGLRTNRGDP